MLCHTRHRATTLSGDATMPPRPHASRRTEHGLRLAMLTARSLQDESPRARHRLLEGRLGRVAELVAVEHVEVPGLAGLAVCRRVCERLGDHRRLLVSPAQVLVEQADVFRAVRRVVVGVVVNRRHKAARVQVDHQLHVRRRREGDGAARHALAQLARDAVGAHRRQPPRPQLPQQAVKAHLAPVVRAQVPQAGVVLDQPAQPLLDEAPAAAVVRPVAVRVHGARRQRRRHEQHGRVRVGVPRVDAAQAELEPCLLLLAGVGPLRQAHVVLEDADGGVRAVPLRPRHHRLEDGYQPLQLLALAVGVDGVEPRVGEHEHGQVER
mmetsp:Transcript_21212/g.62767  ORF Transcript_21212/g.62767 Transcript_21212/m.62767 type:complete len:323 (-) Transcript_21212:410-1378(-)